MKKQFLGNDELDTSDVVANCRMNRERNLVGTNGYDTEIRCCPLTFLQEAAERNGSARWLDLCCGSGQALIEAAGQIESESLRIEITGIDLVGMFPPANYSCLTLIEASLNTWQPEGRFDLVTCIHGLHYIGDKLGLICRAASWLTDEGKFVAHLDLNNIKLEGGKSAGRFVAAALRQSGFEYSFETKLIECNGRLEATLLFEYLGADDGAGPNYTGQAAVDSWYRRKG